jgi:heme oxygenase (biliverdin-producing, ferredoxin)
MNAPLNPPVGLAAMLRQGTMQAHRDAESHGFVRTILEGTVSREAYARFLTGLESLYGALEEALGRHREDSRVAPLYLPEVFRLDAVREDLTFFGRPAQPLASGARYAEHLQALSATAPHRLVAHAYTRYLGDLSGGQALKKSLRRAFQLQGAEGTAFYEFPRLGEGGGDAFKHRYRALLDALPLSDDERGEVVAEAVRAFELNGALVREVSAA